jgi:hypothetical protein
MTRPLPWSHSSLEGFDTCGRQYEELKVLRNFQDQKNDASIWGDQVHIAMEKYLQSGEAMPGNMTQYAPYLDKFKARPGKLLAEQKYGIDIHLRPCSFYGPQVWGRGIVDVLQLFGTVAHVDDHKTGKNRKKNMQQLIIFALLVFLHHPEIQTVVCTFHWLQLGLTDSEVFNRHQMPEMWETLIPKLERYARAFHLGIFPAKPSGLCKRHCAVTTCEHWGSGRR